MASFTPPDPPFEPGEPTPPPQLGVPYPPPLVGEGSPWAPADAENRDRILDWWRMWFLRVFFPWIAAFIDYWVAQWDRLAAYINTWITAADAYITEHAIAGYSIRVTATPIAATGTTNVTITEGLDAEHRPLTVGDIVLDQTDDSRFGAITVVIDSTHATVQVLGSVKGYPGHGWWVTATTIAHTGTTAVVLTADATRVVQLGDLVVDESTSSAYGVVTVVTDPTHVTVAYVNTLQGEQGPQGDPGIPGVVQSVVAGTGIAVDDTDPANPVVSTESGGGVVVAVVAGTGIAVDDTDPTHPIVSADGGGGSTVFATQTLLFAGPTTEGTTYTVENAPGLFWVPLAGGKWSVTGVLQVNVSEDTVGLFDSDFYAVYFDGSGRILDCFHLYSGVTYRWTDFQPGDGVPGLPWDSDWLFVPPANTATLNGADSSGMLKFSGGRITYRGLITLTADTDLGSPLEFQLDTGLQSNVTGDLPVPIHLIGDCLLTDGTSTWRGVVVNSSPGDSSGYFLFVPDLAGSTNFGNDVWAGDVGATVNHTWAAGSVLEWIVELPIDPYFTSYNDGRNGGGDYPVGGGGLQPGGNDKGRGIVYPSADANATVTHALPSQAGVASWDLIYGLPVPPGTDHFGDGIQGTGATFSAGNLVEIDLGGYTPVANQLVQFAGITGITGLTDGTDYYVHTITGSQFTVSATPGGADVPFTGTGTADSATIKNLPAGTVCSKTNYLEYAQLAPNVDTGFFFMPGQAPYYFNWLLYTV